MEHNYIKIN